MNCLNQSQDENEQEWNYEMKHFNEVNSQDQEKA